MVSRLSEENETPHVAGRIFPEQLCNTDDDNDDGLSSSEIFVHVNMWYTYRDNYTHLCKKKYG